MRDLTWRQMEMFFRAAERRQARQIEMTIAMAMTGGS